MLFSKSFVAKLSMLLVMAGLVLVLSSCGDNANSNPTNSNPVNDDGGTSDSNYDIALDSGDSGLNDKDLALISKMLEQMFKVDKSNVEAQSIALQNEDACQEVFLKPDITLSTQSKKYRINLYNYDVGSQAAKDVLGLGDGEYTFVQDLHNKGRGHKWSFAIFKYDANADSANEKIEFIASTDKIVSGKVNKLQISHDFDNDDKVIAVFYYPLLGKKHNAEVKPLKIMKDCQDATVKTPVVKGIVPQYPRVSSSEWITIVGENFKEGATVVLYGASNPEFLPSDSTTYKYVNSTQIQVLPEFTNMTSANVVVYNSADVSSKDEPFYFRVVDVPQITSVTPSPVTVVSGEEADITISGTNFFEKTSIAFYPHNYTENESFYISEAKESRDDVYTYDPITRTIKISLPFHVNDKLRTGEWGLRAHNPHYRVNNCESLLGVGVSPECEKAKKTEYSSIFADIVPLMVKEGTDNGNPTDTNFVDGFDYPIGDRGYKDSAEYELNEYITLYSQDYNVDKNEEYNNFIGIMSNNKRQAKNRANTYVNFQDVGSFYSARGGVHPGEDWNYGFGDDDVGKEVYATANGVVKRISPVLEGGGLGDGWMIVIEHQDKNDNRFTSYYLHVTSAIQEDGKIVEAVKDFDIKVDDFVKRGQMIARIGQTSVPHLHFEIRNKAYNVESYPNDNGSGYYGDTPGAVLSSMTAEQVQEAFLLMKKDGIVDPSDFIDDHRPSTYVNGQYVGGN